MLGRVDGSKGYHDVTRYPEARRVPGLVLFRWDAPLFFANAEVFREHVLQAIADAPTPTKWVVVAAEPVTDIDITAAEALSALDDDLARFGIELCFAEMKDPVKDKLKRYELFVKLGADQFFPTLGQAVDRYLEAQQVEWSDWDEATEGQLIRGRTIELCEPQIGSMLARRSVLPSVLESQSSGACRRLTCGYQEGFVRCILVARNSFHLCGG